MEDRVGCLDNVADQSDTPSSSFEIAFWNNKGANYRVFENGILNSNVGDSSVEGRVVGIKADAR